MSKRTRTPAIPPGRPEVAQAIRHDVEEQARAAKAARARACMTDIEAALKRHNCRLDIVETRVNGQLANVTVQAVALDAPAPNGSAPPPASA